jgi:elongation factor P hydroxylase
MARDSLLYQDLIELFDRLFIEVENTRLIKGDDEPIYLPANDVAPFNRIVFAHGFFSSALHEIAHWCIAGKDRRTRVDYGYWYAPDGRDEHQQKAFEQVEVKPQAIEWAFSLACGKPFDVSVDNLSGVETDRTSFKSKVFEQLKAYCANGFPRRAQLFIDALCQFYQQPIVRKQVEELMCSDSFV